MKKIYTKPDFYYENFALIEAISSCDLISNFNQASACTAVEVIPGEWLFVDALSGCTRFQQPDASTCYGNPVPGYSIYASL